MDEKRGASLDGLAGRLMLLWIISNILIMPLAFSYDKESLVVEKRFQAKASASSSGWARIAEIPETQSKLFQEQLATEKRESLFAKEFYFFFAFGVLITTLIAAPGPLFSSKRGSLFTVVFLIAVIIGFFILVQLQWSPEQREFQTEEEAKQYADAQLNQLADNVKQTLHTALRDAGYRAIYDTAFAGAGANNSYWISYSAVNAPSLNDTKDMISKLTKEYCNQYLVNLPSMNSNLGGAVLESINNVTDIIVWVEDVKLASGDYDESFDVTAVGNKSSRITLRLQANFSGNVENISKELDMDEWTESLPNQRFWYMYRKIKEWTGSNTMAQYACNSMPIMNGTVNVNDADDNEDCYAPSITDDTNLMETIANIGLEELNNKFNDPNITCSYEILCHNLTTDVLLGPACPEGSCPGCPPCKRWNESKPCISEECSNKPLCEAPSNVPELNLSLDPPCKDRVEIEYSPSNPYGEATIDVREIARKEGQECAGWTLNHTLEMILLYTCVDRSSRLEVLPAGPQDLTFNILVHLNIHHGLPWVQPCPCEVGGGGGGGTLPKPPDYCNISDQSVLDSQAYCVCACKRWHDYFGSSEEEYFSGCDDGQGHVGGPHDAKFYSDGTWSCDPCNDGELDSGPPWYEECDSDASACSGTNMVCDRCKCVTIGQA